LDRDRDPRVLVYSKYEAGAWTEPVDILATPGGQDALFPVVIVDNVGQLHVFWSSSEQGPFGSLYHSWVSLGEAMSAQNWQSPILLARGTYQSDAAIDSYGGIHLVYASVEDARGICHQWSDDNGRNWGGRTCVPREYTLRDQEAEERPRLAIDSHNDLHVVWEIADYSPQSQLGYASRAVYYARSLDNGQSWIDITAVEEVESRQERMGFQPDWGNIIVDREDRVHIVWVGSADMRRYHQWSSDGGLTWTIPQIAIPSGGYNRWQGMAVDTSGVLHLVWPSLEGVEYTSWNGSTWATPIVLDKRGSPHQAQAVVALGNRFHIIWQNHGGGDDLQEPGLIVHTMLQTEARSVEPKPLPTLSMSLAPAATARPSAGSAPATSSPTGVSSVVVEAPAPVSNPVPPLLIGLAPAVVLIAIVLLFRLRRNGWG
jgi:hypothetical protein